MYKYIINENHSVKLENENVLDNTDVLSAINFSNEALRNLNKETLKFDINIFDTLGMRNLSGLVGEYFSKSIERFSHENLVSNLHQDGYPDLLLLNSEEKKRYFSTLFTVTNGRKYPRSKEAFSPFLYGGIEIKATCGSTPTASKVPKPLIGEQRINIINSFDWKAHHRETNNLLAIFWDFIDGTPIIAACFYRNDLTLEDWGQIVQPREGGGRTTSVSIMNSQGIQKMCQGWLAVIDNPVYIQKLASQKWIGHPVM
jgi:hypothetical protein